LTGRRGSLWGRGVLVLIVLLGVGSLSWREYREPVRAAVRDYLAQRRVERFQEVLGTAARESGVDPYLLAALMLAESSGRVGARSKTGALGLFQLSMVSARWRAQVLGLPEPTEEQLLTDPLLNARLGADNLAWLLVTYDGNVERALCAYNTGARRLKELTDAAGGWEAWRAEREQAGNSPLLAYVHRILHYRDELRARRLFPETPPTPELEALATPAPDPAPASSAPGPGAR